MSITSTCVLIDIPDFVILSQVGERWKVKDAVSMAPCFCLQGGRGWRVLSSGQGEGIQTQDSWVLLESFPLLGCKAMTNLDSILKSRDITLTTKVHLVKAMVCPVVTYGCESWTVKKAEHRRIDAFELWCWRRLLRVPWTARRSNQSILKQISPGYSLEGLMLKLKLQYFGHLMQRADSLEKTLSLGKIESKWRRGQQRMRTLVGTPTLWTWIWANSGR